MHYVKCLTDPPDTTRINFESLWQQFDFYELLHADTRTPFAAWVKGQQDAVPDLIAAIFTQIHSQQPMDKLLRRALDYCQRILDDQGYDQSSLHQLAAKADPTHQHVALVAGCQGDEVLRSRARAAFRLAKKISPVRFTIVFSGKNPAGSQGRKTVQRRNEAVALERAFDSFVDPLEHYNFEIFLEDKAENTKENISNFFAGTYLRKKCPATLYVVSSSFHVPRLALIAESHISEDKALKKYVKRIVAVGAEDSLEDNPVVGTNPYVKAMMYEVFSHILKYSTRAA